MNFLSVVLFLVTLLLILVSVFLVLVVLAQKSKDGGMAASLGGGAVEATFGAEGGNVLTKSTIVAAVAFFVLAFTLYLGRIYERKHASGAAGSALPTIVVPAAPKSAAVPAPAPGTAAAPATTPLVVPTTAPATTTPATTAPATPPPTVPAPKP
ncbi:MAG: hypothetical protein RLZZ15_3032 [Verrucomicrobiota bacterium]|jgi:preprotein translocase subunit SecG